jgi:hypothetical protein
MVPKRNVKVLDLDFVQNYNNTTLALWSQKGM